MAVNNANWKGSKWIRPDRRLAIYLRDGACCAYCGNGVTDETPLSLDHITPRSEGGENHSDNLITVCRVCNSKRGNMSVEDYAKTLDNTDDVLAHIERCRHLPLAKYRAMAKQILANAPTWSAALSEL